MRLFYLTICCLTPIILAQDGRFEISGNIEYEHRFFLQDGAHEGQGDNSNSISFSPEIYYAWDDDYQSVLFAPFYRYDRVDSRRSHFDIREMFYLLSTDSWIFRLGVKKVFWGVTESIHLVDIVNQIDGVENIDGEDKLGQPMINFALVQDWGTIDFFILPYFRERTFPGRKGRLRSGIPVEIDKAEYESAAAEWHTDFALRYENTFDDIDLGLSYFYGTSREPELQLRPTADGLEIIPFYGLIHQLGLDLQYTYDAWLWKLESIYRNGYGDDYGAVAGGLEYTFFDLHESGMDLGILCEYLWDSRSNDPAAAFQNDLFLGARISLNDVKSTEFLSGIIYDLEGGGHSFFIEAARRVYTSWKVSLEVRTFHNAKFSEPLYQIRQDDHVQLSLTYYF